VTKTVEREIKVRFASKNAAHEAVKSVGATPLRSKRLQKDALFDWPDERLRQSQCVLRVRQENEDCTLTFKGPPESASMKVREEIESTAGNSSNLVTILERLGLEVWFRYEKYREEFTFNGVIVAIDETPVGIFIELEGEENVIHQIAGSLGWSQEDYILDSYWDIFLKESNTKGSGTSDMVFDA